MDEIRDIRRHRNRRLYDTESRRSITQDELAKLVQEGQRVRVTDFATGEDITVAVLGQIAASRVASWPDREEVVSLFRSLIERGGVGVKAINNAILAGLGAITLTREKAEEIVDALIKKGELARGDRKMAIEDLIAKAEEQAKKFSETLKTRAAELRGVRREEYEALQKQVESLREALSRLEAKLAEK